MGYTTSFEGAFRFEPSLSEEQVESLLSFSRERHDPGTYPSHYCQWIPSSRSRLVWDGEEKFYGYAEWINLLIERFFKPWGIVLNGEVAWTGEDSDDSGLIVVVSNETEVIVSSEPTRERHKA